MRRALASAAQRLGHHAARRSVVAVTPVRHVMRTAPLWAAMDAQCRGVSTPLATAAADGLPPRPVRIVCVDVAPGSKTLTFVDAAAEVTADAVATVQLRDDATESAASVRDAFGTSDADAAVSTSSPVVAWIPTPRTPLATLSALRAAVDPAGGSVVVFPADMTAQFLQLPTSPDATISDPAALARHLCGGVSAERFADVMHFVALHRAQFNLERAAPAEDAAADTTCEAAAAPADAIDTPAEPQAGSDCGTVETSAAAEHGIAAEAESPSTIADAEPAAVDAASPAEQVPTLGTAADANTDDDAEATSEVESALRAGGEDAGSASFLDEELESPAAAATPAAGAEPSSPSPAQGGEAPGEQSVGMHDNTPAPAAEPVPEVAAPIETADTTPAPRVTPSTPARSTSQYPSVASTRSAAKFSSHNSNKWSSVNRSPAKASRAPLRSASRAPSSGCMSRMSSRMQRSMEKK